MTRPTQKSNSIFSYSRGMYITEMSTWMSHSCSDPITGQPCTAVLPGETPRGELKNYAIMTAFRKDPTGFTTTFQVKFPSGAIAHIFND